VIRVAVLGAGSHSQREHLPALAHYHRQHPGAVGLAALCDLKVNVAAQFGFGQHCDSLDALLALRPDAIIAITPVDATVEIAARIIAAGIPLLMEKPLGRTIAEARQVMAVAAGKPVMVSMNRRFDPAIVALAEWLHGRRVEHVRATLVRQGRSRVGFIEDVGLHAIDALRFLGGDIVDAAGTQLRFAGGATGALELFPDAGHWVEAYDAFGPGFHGQAQATTGCRVWMDRKLAVDYARPQSQPGFVATGTYGETAAFLDAVARGEPLRPTPAEVVDSMVTAFSVAGA
jgi:predicted dehydrogenase